MSTIIVASSFSQACIAFSHVVAFMGERGKDRERYRVWQTGQLARIEDRETGAMIRCLGSDPRRAHGLAPSLILCDEPSQWPESTGEHGGTGFFGQRVQAMSRGDRKAIIVRDRPDLSLSRQCRLLSIARSSVYYAAKGESPANLALMRRIDELFLKYPFYGSRQMARQLRREGIHAGRHRVRRLMRLMGLQAIYQPPRTSAPHPAHRIYPYLLKRLTIDRPNQVWCADITYIPVSRGFLYLVAIMDWATRHVLSWRLSNTMDAGFCVEAPRAAGPSAPTRRPKASFRSAADRAMGPTTAMSVGARFPGNAWPRSETISQVCLWPIVSGIADGWDNTTVPGFVHGLVEPHRDEGSGRRCIGLFQFGQADVTRHGQSVAAISSPLKGFYPTLFSRSIS